MKPVQEWDEHFLLNLPVGEYDWFEVKGRKALDMTLSDVKEHEVRQILSKAVSAFANSGGGKLVYGLTNPSSGGTGWAIDNGGIATTIKGKMDTREWLETVIPNEVDFPLATFNVYAILPQGPHSQILPGRALYVIDIPDSNQAPHQAFDQKYYIRTGGRSRPIGHRLVIDIVHRRQHPQVELNFSVHIIQMSRMRKVELVIEAQNMGNIYAKYVNCVIYLPPSLASDKVTLFDRDIKQIGKTKYYILRKTNTRRDILSERNEGIETHGPSWFDPILPSLAHSWSWKLPRDYHESQLNNDEEIIWEVYADSAPKRTGQVRVCDVPVIQKQENVTTVLRAIMSEEPGLKLRLSILVILVLLTLTTIWLIPRLMS